REHRVVYLVWLLGARFANFGDSPRSPSSTAAPVVPPSGWMPRDQSLRRRNQRAPQLAIPNQRVVQLQLSHMLPAYHLYREGGLRVHLRRDRLKPKRSKGSRLRRQTNLERRVV